MAKNENLPVVPNKSFELTVQTEVKINPELLGSLDQSDFQGYEQPAQALPIVSIRQKELRDKDGQIVAPAGGFRMFDAVSASSGGQIRDIPGQTGVVVVVIADTSSRVYFASMADAKPTCKSNNGKIGIGSPGGDCLRCGLSQWKPSTPQDDGRPKCALQINALVYDLGLKACYVMRFGRSALKLYNNFKVSVERVAQGKMPLHAFMVNVTTQYEGQPAPHYLPRFELLGNVDLEVFRQMKEIRQQMKDRMEASVEVHETDDAPIQGIGTGVTMNPDNPDVKF